MLGSKSAPPPNESVIRPQKHREGRTVDFVVRHSKSVEVEAVAHHGVRRRSHASCKAVSRQKGDVQERLNTETVAVHASKSLPRHAQAENTERRLRARIEIHATPQRERHEAMKIARGSYGECENQHRATAKALKGRPVPPPCAPQEPRTKFFDPTGRTPQCKHCLEN